jgi:hypothetical protein
VEGGSYFEARRAAHRMMFLFSACFVLGLAVGFAAGLFIDRLL